MRDNLNSESDFLRPGPGRKTQTINRIFIVLIECTAANITEFLKDGKNGRFLYTVSVFRSFRILTRSPVKVYVQYAKQQVAGIRNYTYLPVFCVHN